MDKSVDITIGYTAQLRVYVAGISFISAQEIFWSKERALITTTDDRRIILSKSNRLLTIKSTRVNDEGIYRIYIRRSSKFNISASTEIFLRVHSTYHKNST